MAEHSDVITRALSSIDARECDEAVLVVADFDDFRSLAEESYAEIGAEGAAVAVHHEGQHADAAEQVGVRILYYAVVFRAPKVGAMWGSGLGVQTIIRLGLDSSNFSNLEKAAVLGYPSILSTGDLTAMGELGYDLDLLRQEATFVNRKGSGRIPVPLSGSATLVSS